MNNLYNSQWAAHPFNEPENKALRVFQISSKTFVNKAKGFGLYISAS